MLSFKEYRLKFQSKFPFDFTQNSVLLLVIALILLLSSYALFKPINAKQYQQVDALAVQYSFPKTQEMAAELKTQEKVSNAEYFRLMYAVDFETSKIKEYPALNIEDIR